MCFINYLSGALPAQSKILVADSATETQPNEMASDPAVVLAGKMTLSVISLDSNEEGENGHDEIDESKYTTVSNATAAEKDISDEVGQFLFLKYSEIIRGTCRKKTQITGMKIYKMKRY